MNARKNVATALCLNCGICCDGTLFKDVELQASDDAARLRQLGLKINADARSRSKVAPAARRKKTVALRFAQPCAALGCDQRCHVYDERPSHCRHFECALFIAVEAGELETSAAQRTIRQTRQRAERVRRLLRLAGDQDETSALGVRFRRTRRRLETSAVSTSDAEIFAELALAVHELNLMLRAGFYPDATDVNA